MWYGGEKDRKRFNVRLDKPGHYAIRFNYVWFNNHMQHSTIDVLKRPK